MNIRYLTLWATLVGSIGCEAVTLPLSGGALQQLPPEQIAPAPAPQLRVEPASENTSLAPASLPLQITLRTLDIQGAKIYSETELRAVAEFKPNTKMAINDLRWMLQKITTHYQSHGYVAAQAYLPQQDIAEGNLVIAVVEGHYGKIQVQNQTNMAGSVIADLLDEMAIGDLVRASVLESQLLQVAALPGVKVNSSLVPGEKFGTTDLRIDLVPNKRVTGTLDADNAGNVYTGAYRIGGSLFLNEPLGQGDVASIRLLTSASGLNFFHANYQMHVGRAIVGAGYQSLEYSLGKEFQSLIANGTAKIGNFFANYPLQTSLAQNMSVGLNLANKTFQDHVTSVGSISDKAAHVLTGTYTGDFEDTVWGRSANAYTAAVTLGNIQIQSLGPRTLDIETSKSGGHFSKLSWSASRTQTLNDNWFLFGGLSGQVASKNLDISEKMELGGMYGVRAYPEGEAYADNAVLLTLEARWHLANTLPNVQWIAFFDNGVAQLNAKPWTSDLNRRHLQAAGLGFNWHAKHDVYVRANVAFKVGDEAAKSSKDAASRLWLQAVQSY